jgi:RimJ/RimL family protein N-acetyltransferase
MRYTLGIEVARLTPAITKVAMIIRELYSTEQHILSGFLLALCERDRYRRFCRSMSDEAIHAYIRAIDWRETVVMGAFDAEARLIGMLELCDAGPAAEIAVAVAAAHRSHGVARALMVRALLKAKVLGKQRVMLTCLTENLPMRRLARSVGLSAVTLSQEMESELALESPQFDDLVHDATEALIGNISYASALCSRSCNDLMQQILRSPMQLDTLAHPPARHD